MSGFHSNRFSRKKCMTVCCAVCLCSQACWACDRERECVCVLDLLCLCSVPAPSWVSKRHVLLFGLICQLTTTAHRALISLYVGNYEWGIPPQGPNWSPLAFRLYFSWRTGEMTGVIQKRYQRINGFTWLSSSFSLSGVRAVMSQSWRHFLSVSTDSLSSFYHLWTTVNNIAFSVVVPCVTFPNSCYERSFWNNFCSTCHQQYLFWHRGEFAGSFDSRLN